MAVKDLITTIEDNIDDPSLNKRILPMLNVAQRQFANSYDLPLLDVVGTVETTVDAFKVVLPVNYMKGLWHVGSQKQKLRIGKPENGENNPNYGFARFLKRFPVPGLSIGGIVAVAVKGTDLWYQGVEVDTLNLHYFAHPAPLTVDSTATSLPAHLEEDLLVSFVCWRLYGVIEDGIEGVKTDTVYYKSLLDLAEAQLANFIPRRGEPMYVTDDSDSIYDY
jgi:hypothetical protein